MDPINVPTESEKPVDIPLDSVNIEPASSSSASDENAEEPVKISASALKRKVDATKLRVQQSDPKSPYYSVKSFEELGLNPKLLEGVYAKGYEKPSSIQEIALPNIMSKPTHHFVGQAQSGTGKTAAFTLSMLSRVDTSQKSVQCVCICPTRELANQIYSVITELAKFVPEIKILLALPDAKLPTGTWDSHIVIGTPGKVSDAFRARKIPRDIKMFVIDEADEFLMASKKVARPNTSKPGTPSGKPQQRDNMWQQAEGILRTLAPTCQICLFSATYPDSVKEIVEKVVPATPGRTIMTLEPEKLTLDLITEFFLTCENSQARIDALCKLYGSATVGSAIIFVRTRVDAEKLGKQMKDQGFEVGVIHGGPTMTPAMRDTTIQNFRDGKIRVLITTDLLARGFDVSEITLVINYDLPLDEDGNPDPSKYLHRVGRSGRFGAKGIAVNFVHDQASKIALAEINRYLSAPDPTTGAPLRQRTLHRINLDDMSNFQDAIAALDE